MLRELHEQAPYRPRGSWIRGLADATKSTANNRLRYVVAMCELLGMTCNVPTDIVFSFAGLASRGGKCGPHADGWGLALYDRKLARVFLEPMAAAHSPLASFVR